MSYIVLTSYTLHENCGYGVLMAEPDVDPPAGYRWEQGSRWISSKPELSNSYKVRVLWFRAIEKET